MAAAAAAAAMLPLSHHDLDPEFTRIMRGAVAGACDVDVENESRSPQLSPAAPSMITGLSFQRRRRASSVATDF